MLTLVTGATKNYLERITPFLGTVQQHGAGFDRRVLITNGCRVEMPTSLSSIEAIGLPAKDAGGTTYGCVQHGAFLSVLDGDPSDVIVCIDGDVRMQRPLSNDEASWLRAFPADTIGLGWNAGPHDTLRDEAYRLRMTVEWGVILDRFPFIRQKVYNCGVMVMRRATYQRLYDAYMQQWPTFRPLFDHYAANQFLQCHTAHELGLRVWELPPLFHTHGCFGLPSYATDSGDGTLSIDDKLVLFRHHWYC